MGMHMAEAHSGGGNNINLAAMWVPVMPETSHLKGEMRKIGEDMRKSMLEGFGAGGSGGGGPEELGGALGDKVLAGFHKKLSSADFGLLSTAFEKFNQRENGQLADRLKTELPQAYRAAEESVNRLQRAERELTETRREAVAATTAKRAAEERLAAAERTYQELAAKGLTQSREGVAADHEVARQRRELAEATRQLAHAQAQERTQTNSVNTAREKASASVEDVTQKMNQFHSASARMLVTGTMLGTIIGSVVVGAFNLLTGAMEGIVHLGEHIFDSALEGARDFANELVEVGHMYHHLGVQVQEYSGASGAALDQLTEHAQMVFGTLDVAGEDTGQVMAQFASGLNMQAGPALDKLTQRVERLRGRYANLNPSDLIAFFSAFKTPADQVNDVLATMLQQSQQAGVGLGTLASSLSGEVSSALKEMGFNADQALHFMAEMDKRHVGQNVMMYFANAQKIFSQKGWSFAEGMRNAAQELQKLGDTAQGNDLAQKLFGRRWTEIVPLIQTFLDSLNGSFNASADGVDRFLDSSETLESKIQAFKHTAMGVFAPFGVAAVDLGMQGLTKLSEWFNDHRDSILHTIRDWGDKFIDMIPKMKQWGEDFVDIIGDAAAVLAPFVALLMAGAGAQLVTWGVMSADFNNVKEGLGLIKDSAQIGVDAPQKILDLTDKLHQKIQDFNPELKKYHDNWDQLSDSTSDAADKLAALNDVQNSLGDSFARMNANGSFHPSGFMNSFGGGIFSGGMGGLGGGVFTGGGGTGGARIMSAAYVTGGVPDESLWTRVAQAESGGNWSNADTGHNGHYGGLQFAPNTWVTYGGLQFAPRADLASPLQQMIVADRTAFTGWNGAPPEGLGAWETITNGSVPVSGYAGGGVAGGFTQGLLQSVGFTPRGTDTVPAMLTPGEYVVNAGAAAKYGPLLDMINGGRLPTSGIGMSLGGPVRYLDGGGPATGAGGGGGGMVDQFGVNIGGAQVDTIRIADELAQMAPGHPEYLYRSPDGFDEHSSGEAVDFMVGGDTGLGYAVKDWALGQPGVMYALWQQRQWNPDGSVEPMENRGTPTQNHMDHVHIRTVGGGYPPGMGPNQTGIPYGSFPAGTQLGGGGSGTQMAGYGGMGGGGMGGGGMGGGGMPFIGGVGGGFNPMPFFGGGPGGMYDPKTGLPGIPGQYGGYGAYSGETLDQTIERQNALRSAQGELDQLTQERDQLQGDIAKKQQKLNQLHSEDQILQDTVDKDQIDSLTSEIQSSQQRLKQLNTVEIPNAQGELTIARNKQQESFYHSPKGMGAYNKGEYNAAEQLGSGFLSGIAQELGFPDLFGGKPIWDWGIVKLLTKGLSLGMSWLNQIGDKMYPSNGQGFPGAAAAGYGLPGQFPMMTPAQEVSPFGSQRGAAPGPNSTTLHMPTTTAPSGNNPAVTLHNDYGPHGYPGRANSSPPNSTLPASYTINHHTTINPHGDKEIASSLANHEISSQRNMLVANSPGTFHA